ncbi:MAG: TIR domain-containing protein, partial [Bacteroidetes bacterium]
MTKHAFISYKSEDANFTIQLATDLKNAGFRVWVDRLQGIETGEEWLAAIGEALENSSALIAVITPEYFTSKYCRKELEFAFLNDIPIIPIMLRPTDFKTIPKNFFWLEGIHYTSFENYVDDQQIYEDGLAAIQDRLRGITPEFEGPVPDAEAQYLNTLIGELTKWQGVEEYIALQAEAEQRVNPEEKRIDPALALIIKMAKKQEEKPQTEPLQNIAEAVEKLPRFVLIGDPGAGKTTTLRYLALEQARRRLAWLEAGRKGPPPPIPHIVYLPQWKDGQTPLAFVQSQWTLGGDLAHELQKGNVWLYLDGLNEMGAKGPEKAAQLRAWLKAAENAPQHVIVTCRKDDYNEALDLQQNTVLVKPLEDEQIRAFAARYLSEEKVEPFLARIFPQSRWEERRSLIHLARNPYMLAALLTVYEYQGELPTNTGALFHTLAQVLWERERLRNTRGWVAFEQMRERFGQLAFDMIDTDQPLDVSITDALKHIEDKGLLKAGASAGFIRLNQDSLRFSHQLMLEYFAAWGLQRVGVKTSIRPPEFSWFGGRRAQKWDEVVVALCGIVDDASDLISHIAEVDRFLAADCIGSGVEVSPACQSAIVTQLIQALKDEDREVRRAAAEALMKIGQPAVLHLIQALNDEESDVRYYAAWALGKIGDAQAVPQLIQALKDEDRGVRRAAAEALVKIGQQAVPQLCQALKDEEWSV